MDVHLRAALRAAGHHLLRAVGACRSLRPVHRAHNHLRRATAHHAGHADHPAVDPETGVVNVSRQRHESMSFNEHLAVYLTDHVGTMQTAYVFAGIGVASLVGAVTNNAFLAATFGALSSYFLQLVLLPIISVGQNVNARHGEARASADFDVNRRSLKALMALERVNARQLQLIEEGLDGARLRDLMRAAAAEALSDMLPHLQTQAPLTASAPTKRTPKATRVRTRTEGREGMVSQG